MFHLSVFGKFFSVDMMASTVTSFIEVDVFFFYSAGRHPISDGKLNNKLVKSLDRRNSVEFFSTVKSFAQDLMASSCYSSFLNV